MYNSILFLIILGVFTPKVFEKETETFWNEPKERRIFTADGQKIDMSYKDQREPFEIIDTVRIRSGSGTLKLKRTASKGRIATVPTDTSRISVLVTARELSDSVVSWEWKITDFKDNAQIEISNNGDSSYSGLVDVHIKVR